MVPDSPRVDSSVAGRCREDNGAKGSPLRARQRPRTPEPRRIRHAGTLQCAVTNAGHSGRDHATAPGCKGQLPSPSGFSQRAARPRRQRSRRCADLHCTKSPLAELWLGCRTPRVHSSSESWGRGSPTNSKFRPVYAQDVRLRVGGVRGTFTQSGSDRPDRVESLGGERLSLARPRPQVERATASH